MKTALTAGSLVALFCSYLGVFVVLRRIIFVSIALASFSSLGVAVAVFFGKNPLFFSFIFAFIGVYIFSRQNIEKRLPRESVIGLSYALASALAILFLAKSAHGEADMLNLIFGNILSISNKNIFELIAVLIPVGIIHVMFYKEFLFSAYDSEMAEALGMKVSFWNFLFYLTLGAVVAVSIHITGVLLVFTFLLVPAMFALNIANSIKLSIGISFIVAEAVTWLGLIFSFVWDLPSSSLIIAFCGGTFLFSILYRKAFAK
ncbi:MAG: metal ABC transporter permease [Armatimonadetes bacterium]|nr:metal ABC transporter permease [Armatimonadota bacterium]